MIRRGECEKPHAWGIKLLRSNHLVTSSPSIVGSLHGREHRHQPSTFSLCTFSRLLCCMRLWQSTVARSTYHRHNWLVDMAVVVVGQTVRGNGASLHWLCMEASRPPTSQPGCSNHDCSSGALVDLAEHEGFCSARSPQMGDDGTFPRLRIATSHL